jgi:Holliday junction resolvase RusA-like endonuclease
MKTDTNTSKINIIISGRIPSKKNSKLIICRGKFPMIISNPKFQAWHEEQMWRLKTLRLPKEPITRCIISIEYYAPDLRSSDLDNKNTTILDLLKDANVIFDDNWNVVHCLNSKLVAIDRDNPRAEITITKTGEIIV